LHSFDRGGRRGVTQKALSSAGTTAKPEEQRERRPRTTAYRRPGGRSRGFSALVTAVALYLIVNAALLGGPPSAG
jgi:hypothetical protein